jgi:L-amino acid N-acyltransferase YncA
LIVTPGLFSGAALPDADLPQGEGLQRRGLARVVRADEDNGVRQLYRSIFEALEIPDH